VGRKKGISYKKLYLQEKMRREYYEKINPALLALWEKQEAFVKQLNEDMEKAMFFGDSSLPALRDSEVTRCI